MGSILFEGSVVVINSYVSIFNRIWKARSSPEDDSPTLSSTHMLQNHENKSNFKGKQEKVMCTERYII